jgi:EAL domain-containing protein (putative c-di-GMP-specific phosphodiesterase class I)
VTDQNKTEGLAWLSDRLDVLIEALIEGGALGLIVVDASALTEVERRYGAMVLQGSLDLLVESLRPTVEEALGRHHLLLGQVLEPERLLIFGLRPRTDRRFYTRLLPRLADHLREHVSVAVQRIAYPYLTGIFDVPVGHALVLHRPFQRPESEVRRLIESALDAGRFAAERMRRERGGMLERLIIEEGLSTVYEPIVSLKDNSVLGYEALTRGPAGTPLESPLVCFNVAQRCELDFELDNVCRRRALQNANGLKTTESLFLNILPSSIHDPDFSTRGVRTTLAELEISPSQIVFEISERQTIGNYPRFREALDRLTELGFRVAIDDVGAGYANLETAIELSPDFLKIDRTLIRLIDSDPQKQELLSGLVRLGEKMKARLIAEGIETDSERAVLRDLGVTFGQGYAIGRGRAALAAASDLPTS